MDAPGRDLTRVVAFVRRQEALVAGERGAETPEESVLREVMAGPDGDRLRPAVCGMLAALRFDAERDSRPIRAEALQRQVERVGDAFVGSLWVCAGEPGLPPAGVRELARAACLVHLLRDREVDRTLGYENRPPGPDGDPIADSAWVGALASEAEHRFTVGNAALSAPMRWRMRWLLRQYAGRYRRALGVLVPLPTILEPDR